VATLAGQLRYAALRSALASNGIVAMTPEGRFTGQAVITGSVYSSALSPWRWELAASGSAFGLSGAAPTTSAQLVAREHLALGSGGLFAGTGRAVSVHRHTKRGAWLVQAGGFVRPTALGGDELSSAMSYTAADRVPSPLVPPDENVAARRYADAFAYWQHTGRTVELLVGGGIRSTSAFDGPVTSWASVTATMWASPRVAVVASAGRALEDVVRGVPTVRYASIAIRFAFQNRDAPVRLRIARQPALDDGQPIVQVAPGDGETRIVKVRASATSTVELMADFTEWEAVALARDSTAANLWTISCRIVPGSHRVAVRVDGGEWIVPANLPRVADDFGGTAGLLIVP
jgi:hypothetical protein